MSKTLGTVVDPLEAASRFGPDPLRLYMVREITFGQDGDFSWERFEGRYNADLANNLGNLVSRLTTMAKKYRDGELPPAGEASSLAGRADETRAGYQDAMERYALQEGVGRVFDLIDATNEFLTEKQPWSVAKDAARTAELSRILFDAAEALRVAAVLLTPIMPRSAGEILRRLGQAKPVSDLRLTPDAMWGTGGTIRAQKGPALWPRLGSETVPLQG